MLDPVLAQLASNLAEVVLKNTAEVIYTKISAAKAKKDDKETINTLSEIVNELVSDKNELVNISKCYEAELVAQKISDDDIIYITEKLIPIFSSLIKDEAQINAIKPLLSTETIKILQILGFNFKEAIGEPLTKRVASFLQSQSGGLPNNPKNRE
jgi:hypothetical protein